MDGIIMAWRSRNKSPTSRARTWRVSIIRKYGKVLGIVEAPSREKAEAAAVRAFMLSEEQGRRLIVQQRG
jgi:hypothetical protein